MEKKSCENCINMTKYGCETMIEPFADLSCWTSVSQKREIEEAIIKYGEVYGSMQDAELRLRRL